MSTLWRAAAFAFAAGLPSVSMTTCVDIEYSVTLKPDGTGKFILIATSGGEEIKTHSPDEILRGGLDITRQTDGFAAWLEPVVTRHGKVSSLTLTGYFDDINKVRLYNDEPGKKRDLILSFELRKSGKGGTLTCTDAEVEKRKVRAAEPATKDETSNHDDRYWVTVQPPGKITAAKGFTESKDRTAMIRIDDKVIFSARKGDKEALKITDQLASPMTVTWAKDDISEEGIAKFRKEFAAAREAWKSLKPRHEKLRQEMDKEKKD